MRRSHLAAVLVTLLVPAVSFAYAPPEIQHCNNAGFETILEPAAMSYEASAYWLNRSAIKWPNARKDPKIGRFQLVYSDSANLIAKVGEPIKGAQGYIALSIGAAPVAAAIATRFKYVADGVVLNVATADAAKLVKLHSAQMLIVETNAQNNVVAAAALQIAGALDDRYSAAAKISDLGVLVLPNKTAFKL